MPVTADAFFLVPPVSHFDKDLLDLHQHLCAILCHGRHCQKQALVSKSRVRLLIWAPGSAKRPDGIDFPRLSSTERVIRMDPLPAFSRYVHGKNP